jgi:hypothetical protein
MWLGSNSFLIAGVPQEPETDALLESAARLRGRTYLLNADSRLTTYFFLACPWRNNHNSQIQRKNEFGALPHQRLVSFGWSFFHSPDESKKMRYCGCNRASLHP